MEGAIFGGTASLGPSGYPVVGERTAAVAEFVGYGKAAEYLNIRKSTLSAYCSRGQGPKISRTTQDGQYVRPVFLVKDLDAWRAAGGQGRKRESVE